MRNILLPVLILICSFSALAQDFQYGSHTDAEMDMKRYDKDTSAHAVVLREFGKAYMDNDYTLTINFLCHVKIKILDSKGLGNGNIVLRQSKYEQIKNIRGVTFFKDENGVEQHSDLADQNIFRETNGNNVVVKFALPNLHDNCIIEYTYTKTNTYHYNFQYWRFQWDIPNIYSEYQTEIPAFYSYNILLRGNQKLSKKETTIENGCVVIDDIRAGCIKTTYAMENIPAFVKEDYTTANDNFISALHFELYATKNSSGERKNYADDWSKVDYNLLTGEDFGVQLRRKRLLKDMIPHDILNITDTLARAQAVYAYVQKLFKFNHGYSNYSLDIKAAIEKHKGDSGDINLSLIAALAAAGINTDAVILSTTDNGVVSKFFPTVSEFNYVVARIVIENKQYLLDATDPLLSFGLLPVRCINDQGRVIISGKPSYWINLDAPEKNKTITNLDVTLLDNGKIKGIITKYSFGYAAYNKRVAIKKFNGVDEYVENLDERSTKLKILTSAISNIDSLNLPLIETYQVELNDSDKFGKEKNIAFTPAFWSRVVSNPFIQTTRNYPVYLGYSSDYKMILTMHYPDGYEILNHPADVGLIMPNKGGMFATKFQATPGVFNYAEAIQLNKPIYSAEEYPYLKEFYNKIIQTQKATIEFRKKP